jgi:hypothetical protein
LVIKTLPNDDHSRLARIGASGPDLPITLKDACRDVFKDRITVAALMAEHRRGTLVIYKIGRQYFTTLNELNAMLVKCRLEVTPIPETRLSAKQDSAHAALAAIALASRLKAAGRKNSKG